MPHTVERPTWDLRPEAASDRAFLRAVYADVHGDDFAGFGLPAATQQALFDHQLAAREQSWRTTHPDGRWSIVEVDGVPAGRLLVSTDATGIRLVDIALLREYRGHGLGTALVTGVVADADRRRLSVTLHVDRANPARRLYERLGFVTCAEDAFRVRMRHEPPGGLENGASDD